MIRLFPYANINGNWTVNDSVMSEIYQKLKKEGTLKSVFYDKGMDEIGFIQIMKHSSNLPIIAVYNDEIAAIAWLNGFANGWAFAHFAMFRNVYGDKSLEIAKYILSYWFNLENNGEKVFNTLVGITPRDHEKALSFIQKIGFEIVGAIPNLCAGSKDGIGVISFIAR